MRIGLKTLLYLAGSDACRLLGDFVLPTSNALPVFGAAGGSVTVLGFCNEVPEDPICGEECSGSSAAPGSFNDGGGLPMSVGLCGSSSGGLPIMLP